MTHPTNSRRARFALYAVPTIFLALMSVAPMSQADSGGRYAACPSCAPQDLAWADGEFDQVYLATDSSGRTNAHPQIIVPDAIAKALGTVRYKGAGGMTSLLDEEGAANLAQGISKALAKATPGQDAIFLVTTKMSGGLFGVKLGNSGRAFYDSNGLNLIVGEAHVEFVAPYRATRMARAFKFGSRSSASAVTLESEGAVVRRNDWLVLPVAAGGVKVQAAAQAPAAPAAQAVVRDEQYYAAQEARLKGLKRLREQNLITEEEYQGKRGEILKAW